MNEPLKELLDRRIGEQIQPELGCVAEMMDRSVNYGTHLIAKCDRNTEQKQVLAAVLLGLHAVEVLDSIAVLVRNCCIDPAKALLRGQMEAMFAIEYMAQGDLERKAIQYLVGHTHARIDWYKKLAPTTETGKQLKARLSKDQSLHGLDIVELDTTAHIDNLEKMLARKEYAIVEAEWQRVRRQREGSVWWYALFDGPKRVEDLATAVGDHAWYEILYRFYSGEIHATNAIESLHASLDAQGTFQTIRYPADLPTVAQLALSMAFRTYRSLIDMFVPDERQPYADWYTKEIKMDLNGLATFRIVDPSRPSKRPLRRRSI
jgi:hypothetical protein